MKYIKVADMNISAIIIGTDYYSTKYSEKTCTDILDTYIENGGNMIDTARLYCSGKSEEFIGKYIEKNNLRNKIYIATKAAHPKIESMHISRLSKKEIESDVEKSLEALRTDSIDLLWLHRDDESLPTEPIIDVLEGLVKKGKIKHYGASNWTHSRISSANKYAKSINAEGFIASQIQWSLAKPNKIYDHTLVHMNDEEFCSYSESKIPVFAFCSQAKGFFEKYATGTLSEKAKERFYSEENIKMFKKIKKESEKTGKTISAITVDSLTENKNFPALAIIGPSNVNQLKSTLNIKASDS